MTATLTSTQPQVRITSWTTWCAFAGCQNCVRVAVGDEPIHVHCAEHATMTEIVYRLAAPIHTLDQLLRQPMVRRGWMAVA